MSAYQAGFARLSAGVGLKPEHADDIFAGPRCIDFFEVHAENYMGAGGPPHHLLRRIRAEYPLSIHGVGLSIGGVAPLDRDHLRRLRRLVDVYQPALFSEHLAWSSHDGVFLNDLLPLPYNDISLAHVCAHVDAVQDALKGYQKFQNLTEQYAQTVIGVAAVLSIRWEGSVFNSAQTTILSPLKLGGMTSSFPENSQAEELNFTSLAVMGCQEPLESFPSTLM